jgi:8-amino-7-oxononanoate synthase
MKTHLDLDGRAAPLNTGSFAAPASVVSSWAEEDLAALSARGLVRSIEPLSTPQGAVIRIGEETLVNFSSNDYLGLAADARVIRALGAGAERHGVGSGASRLLVGDSLAHHALEAALSGHMGTEAALLFNSGYAANVGVLSALCGPGDVVFSDALNHASIVDGCRLSRAKVVVYPHADMAALDTLLREHSGRRRLVCTDAIFSMDGDRAPVRELVALCRLRGAALMVDEAHALGMIGPTGAGLCEELGLASQVDVRVGTLGKALGAAGAFVATSRSAVQVLINRARSQVFSTALPPPLCAAACCALELSRSDPTLRQKLWRNIRRFAGGLRQLGFAAEVRSAIFPIVIGEADAAVAAARRIRDRGVLAKAIRPPTVPPGSSRLRFAMTAAHSEAHVDMALDALSALERPRAC